MIYILVVTIPYCFVTISHLQQMLGVCCTEKEGRYCVATGNVEPGDLLLFEPVSVFALEESDRQTRCRVCATSKPHIAETCAHCLRPTCSVCQPSVPHTAHDSRHSVAEAVHSPPAAAGTQAKRRLAQRWERWGRWRSLDRHESYAAMRHAKC